MRGLKLAGVSNMKTIEPPQNGWGTAQVDGSMKNDCVNKLTDADMRAQAIEEEEDDMADEASSAGCSSSAAKAPVSRNRPPFLKNDPRLEGDPQHFTVRELKRLFSARSDFFLQSRLTAATKVIEDSAQALYDVLPFGLKLHRRVGAGARTNKSDGVPGFLSKVGVTVYFITAVEFDEQDKMVSLEGVGINGERTKAYVWH